MLDGVGIFRLAGAGGVDGRIARGIRRNSGGNGSRVRRFMRKPVLFRLVGDGDWCVFVRVAGVVFCRPMVRRVLSFLFGGRDVFRQRRRRAGFAREGVRRKFGGTVSESENDYIFYRVFAAFYQSVPRRGRANCSFGGGVFRRGVLRFVVLCVCCEKIHRNPWSPRPRNCRKNRRVVAMRRGRIIGVHHAGIAATAPPLPPVLGGDKVVLLLAGGDVPKGQRG